MARQKQSWRETASYCTDSGGKEDEHEKESPSKDNPSVMSLVRPQESYEHPVFKSISKANNFVNSMTEEAVIKKLSELGLSTKYVFHICVNFELNYQRIQILMLSSFSSTKLSLLPLSHSNIFFGLYFQEVEFRNKVFANPKRRTWLYSCRAFWRSCDVLT